MLHGHQAAYVILSVGIAILGSWTALDLNGRVRAHSGGGRWTWLTATALAMSLSIWSMHFVAMLGFNAGVPVTYDVLLTILSLLLAIVPTAAAFFALHASALSRLGIAAAALAMGTGISLMHYVGMAAVRAPATLDYQPLYVILSFVIAVVASWAALHAVRRERSTIVRLIGAAVLGLAIAAMHYTAMAGATFTPTIQARAGYGDLGNGALTFAVASSTLLLLATALIAALFDRRFEAIAVREAQARARADNEAQLRRITDALPVLISHVDPDLRYTFVNRTYEQWFGRDRRDVIGASIRDIAGDETFTALLPQMRAALSGEPRVAEQLATYPSGARHIRVHYVPDTDGDGRSNGFFALIEDISEIKQHQEALADSERRMRTVLESSSDGFLACDGEWRLTLINRAAEQSTGISRHAALGLPLWEVLPSLAGSTYEVEFRRVMADQSPVTFTAESFARPDSYLEMRVSPKEGGGIAASFSDVTERILADRHRDLLVNELNHRVKNTLAIVQSIAMQSLGDDVVPGEVWEAFEGRLLALSNAHNVLTDEHWEAASLHALIETALRPFGGPDRFTIEGDAVRLRPKAAVSLSLALHELATNAAKYGALSAAAGRVRVTATVTSSAPQSFVLRWVEQGGPLVISPSRRGFGSRLVQRGLAAELGGSASIDFAPEGVVCRIEAPLANVEQR